MTSVGSMVVNARKHVRAQEDHVGSIEGAVFEFVKVSSIDVRVLFQPPVQRATIVQEKGSIGADCQRNLSEVVSNSPSSRRHDGRQTILDYLREADRVILPGWDDNLNEASASVY